MMRWMFAWVLLAGAVGVSRGQVYYEPVQSQYGGAEKFYYGGSDPRQIAFGEWAVQMGHDIRAGRSPCTVGMAEEHFPLVNPRVLVLCDALPYTNAALRGVTPEMARDQALAGVPRYFRKRDILAAGIPTAMGLIVPAQAQPRPTVRAVDPEDAPGVILIVPAHSHAARPQRVLARADGSSGSLSPS